MWEGAARLIRKSFEDFRPVHQFGQRHPFFMIAIAILVGLAVGYAALLFRMGLSAVQFLFFGEASEYLAQAAAGLAWWHVLLAPAVGGVAVSCILRFMTREKRPLGVGDVIEASIYHQGRMSLWSGISAALVSIVSVGAGASTGREGPVVHLGGAIAGSLGQYLKFSRMDGHTTLACGVAAGVAASFNAPIAGVIFAHEVVLGHYALRALAPVVISSVIGTLVTRLHIGDFPAFLIPHYDNLGLSEIPAFMLLGLVSGLMALVFFWSIAFSREVFAESRLPVFWRPPLAGLAVGAIALMFPEVLGVGYEATDNALKQFYSLEVLVLLVAAKMAATSISIGGGFGGGVFSPALFIGAMTGGAFGIIAAGIFPDHAASHGLYSIVGMGAVAAAVLGAPISTTLIVFELTGDYRVTIALMAAVVLSTMVGRQFRHKSFFHWQLAWRAVELAGADEVILRARTVADVMKRNFSSLPGDATVADLRDAYRESGARAFFVIDEAQRLTGLLPGKLIRQTLLTPGCDDSRPLQDLAQPADRVLTPAMSLDQAMAVFRGTAHLYLPVVEAPDSPVISGLVDFADLLAAHNRALKEAREEME